MTPADLQTGATVYWRRDRRASVLSGTVLGWVEPGDRRRGRGDLVLVRLADAPEFSFLWDREGRYVRRVPVKALRSQPWAERATPKRVERTRETAAELLREVQRLVTGLRGEAGGWAEPRDGGRGATLTLSAQDATALLAVLRGARA